MVLLITRFNGQDALGGIYDPVTHTFTKRCKHPKGGRHPFKDAYGGFDSHIIDKLRDMGCQMIILSLADCQRYITFQNFVEYSFVEHWHDPRFHFPRYYAPAYCWSDNRAEAMNLDQ